MVGKARRGARRARGGKRDRDAKRAHGRNDDRDGDSRDDNSAADRDAHGGRGAVLAFLRRALVRKEVGMSANPAEETRGDQAPRTSMLQFPNPSGRSWTKDEPEDKKPRTPR